ncbi:MMPL family transporter [Streptomyces sp. NBC_01092]|uniref:MMPL family transporter n=1 Tax=Streptomyces sp. NBC_01092 TaxID=2903748 RepID=UPI00386F0DF3
MLVGIGVLLDAFLVRTVLVPVLALDLSRWSWWPGGLFRHLGSDDVDEPCQTLDRQTARNARTRRGTNFSSRYGPHLGGRPAAKERPSSTQAASASSSA